MKSLFRKFAAGLGAFLLLLLALLAGFVTRAHETAPPARPRPVATFVAFAPAGAPLAARAGAAG